MNTLRSWDLYTGLGLLAGALFILVLPFAWYETTFPSAEEVEEMEWLGDES